jgi:hypothetical protein
MDGYTLSDTRTLTLREIWIIFAGCVLAGTGIGGVAATKWAAYDLRQSCVHSGGEFNFGKCFVVMRSGEEWKRLRELGMVDENGYLRQSPPSR